MVIARSAFVAAVLLIGADLGAQSQPVPTSQSQAAQAAPIPRAAPSTRATVEVQVDRRWTEGAWNNEMSTSGPARIAIDYGQPHLRGRNVIGMPGVVPWDSVWRTGANMSTQLTAEVDLTIGNAFIPRGIYTLFSLPTRTGWKLIVSKQVLQWGTDYDPAQDFARIDLRARTLAEPLESLTFWLVPARENPPSKSFPHVVLKLAWGNLELSTDWRVGR